jgi:hypothetical protein
MAFVPVTNVVQCEMRYTLDDQKCENRIMIDVGHTPDASDFTNIANAVSNALITEWLPLLPATLVYTELFLRSMEEQNGPQATFPIDPGVGTGTNIGSALPNNCTLCVSLRSNFAGRSARGRLYWPALLETTTVDSHVDSSHVAGIVLAVRGLDTNLTTVGTDWVIVSFFNNNAPRPGGPVKFSVTNVLIVDDVVDSQRRRLPGRGQ